MKKHHFSWSGLYLTIVFIILYAPIVYLVVYSFSAGTTMEKYHGFSLRHYADLFADTRMITIVFNTLIVALLAALIATIVGTLGALAIKETRGKVRNSLLSLNNVLMVSPRRHHWGQLLDLLHDVGNPAGLCFGSLEPHCLLHPHRGADGPAQAK